MWGFSQNHSRALQGDWYLGQGYFCGRHKPYATADHFTSILEALKGHGHSLAAIVSKRNESEVMKAAVLDDLRLFITHRNMARMEAENRALKIKEQMIKLSDQVKAQKEKVGRRKGSERRRWTSS